MVALVITIDNNQTQAVVNSNNLNNGNSQSQQGNSNKWVINLSKMLLTKGKESVLAKGPNFAIAPNKIPYVDYITAVESMYQKLKEEGNGKLRADINLLLRRSQVPKPNLFKQESIGLAQPEEDKDRVVLTANKGVAMVVMDREDYIQKAQSLLAQPAYRTIDRDATNKIKATLINTLRKIKKDKNIGEGLHKTMYPTGCMPPGFMAYLKSIKQVPPLGQSFQAGGQLHMGLLRSLQRC